MSPHDAARAVVVDAMRRVAPDVDVDAIDPHADLEEAAGLDSMDLLNVVVAVYEATGLEIPERDYPELGTFAGFVAYVAARRPG
jgi:acyl carrier protein